MMKVLIVDDNPINRLLPIAWLKRLGCETEESAGGTDALAKLATGGFDVVLLDLSMPEMSGTEICRRTRAMPGGGRIRIIAYTAHAAPEAFESFRSAGFDDVLVKPVTRDALLGAFSVLEGFEGIGGAGPAG
ncbi:response regulator [Thauera phenylacetica]|uniref:response regulator n=1 Tax=Thauera phenylacetica TaxID=164400 RepID=UPI0039E2A1E9